MFSSHGKCPNCGEETNQFESERAAVKLSDSESEAFRQGVSIFCSSCRTILGVALDPVSLKADTVAEILDALGVDRKMQ